MYVCSLRGLNSTYFCLWLGIFRTTMEPKLLIRMLVQLFAFTVLFCTALPTSGSYHHNEHRHYLNQLSIASSGSSLVPELTEPACGENSKHRHQELPLADLIKQMRITLLLRYLSKQTLFCEPHAFQQSRPSSHLIRAYLYHMNLRRGK